MPSSIQHLVVGLPGAGKTTFIGALWHVLTSSEIAEALQLDKLQPSRDHLNEIARLWRSCEEIPRTMKEQLLTLHLRKPESRELLDLTLPDSSGEAFKRIFEKRRWSVDLAQQVRRASGLLFFIHPDNIVPPQVIDPDVEDMVATLDAATEPQVADPEEKPVPWTASLSTPQSKIVDLLQLIKFGRDGKGIKTGIVISAWDEVKGEGHPPDVWLEQRTPLLHQYLRAQSAHSAFRVFGLSAQGGPLTNSARLLQKFRASDRIELNDNGEISHNITAPIRWLIG